MIVLLSTPMDLGGQGTPKYMYFPVHRRRPTCSFWVALIHQIHWIIKVRFINVLRVDHLYTLVILSRTLLVAGIQRKWRHLPTSNNAQQQTEGKASALLSEIEHASLPCHHVVDYVYSFYYPSHNDSSKLCRSIKRAANPQKVRYFRSLNAPPLHTPKYYIIGKSCIYPSRLSLS